MKRGYSADEPQAFATIRLQTSGLQALAPTLLSFFLFPLASLSPSASCSYDLGQVISLSGALVSL